MNEVWKCVVGYEKQYQVSNLGNVRSVDRVVHDSIGRTRHLKGKALKPKINRKNGYAYLNLSGKDCYVHRIVANAFIPNPNHYPEVNHKDETKTNNCASNLEWCDRQYNHDYGTRTKKESLTKSYPVQQIDKNGKVIASYTSAIEASEKTGINRKTIQMVAKHYCYTDYKGNVIRYLTAGGYKWEYIKKGK